MAWLHIEPEILELRQTVNQIFYTTGTRYVHVQLVRPFVCVLRVCMRLDINICCRLSAIFPKIATATRGKRTKSTISSNPQS